MRLHLVSRFRLEITGRHNVGRVARAEHTAPGQVCETARNTRGSARIFEKICSTDNSRSRRGGEGGGWLEFDRIAVESKRIFRPS